MSSDPSYSRTYLTTSNNNYESIHTITTDSSLLAERQERNDRLIRHRSDAAKRSIPPLLKVAPAQSPAVNSSSNSISGHARIAPAMVSLGDEDVNRPPDSSDEENQEQPNTIAIIEADTSVKRKASSPKRPLDSRNTNTDRVRRSKRQKTSGEENLPSTMPEKSLQAFDEIDPFFSQLSPTRGQSRRPGFKKTYNSSQRTTTPASSAPQTKRLLNTFRSVSEEALSDSEVKQTRQSKARLKNVSSSPPIPPSSRQKQKQKSKVVESSPVEPDPIHPAVFQTVEDLDSEDEPTSNATSSTSKNASIDKAEKKRDRRGSSSSLSSIESLIEYQLDASQKAALMSDSNDLPASQTHSISATLPPNHILCPTCRRSTSLLNLPGYNARTNPSTLSLRDQTRFCYSHRIRDARDTWSERDYPSITWSTLATSPSLTSHIKSLIPVLRRKTPSYYLSKLDTAISSARGNQSEINRAFDVTNIHHGYYGPRGAKIITKAIMENDELQKVLNRALRSDKNMRIAGLGRLTDAVLLPEVLVAMVQEDLVLGRREEAGIQARIVLEDSVELGLLLCNDDDEVDGEDDIEQL